MTVMTVQTMAFAGPVHAQMRVVNYNIAQLNGNLVNLQNVFTAMHADDKPGFAAPVSIFVFQEVQGPDFVSLLTMLNNTAPPGVDYVGATFTTTTAEDNSGAAQAMFYRLGMFTENVPAHQDIATGAGRNSDRWQLNLVSNPGVSLYVYGSHLKSDEGLANQQERLNGVNAIRTNADVLGAAHVIYCGDLNFYNNNEPGYLRYFQAGNGQAFDPFGTGSWAGGAGSPNNIKHTQSPRLASGVLIGGGMDDRFDFQLPTAEFNDGAGLAVIPALPHTHRTFGNDGMHFDQAINTGGNAYYPANPARSLALANDLFAASDHLPIIVDYQVPAVMAATMPSDLGRLIQHAAVAVPITVTNQAQVALVQGADELSYHAVGSGVLSGAASDTVLPLGDTSSPTFPFDAGVTGLRQGQVQVTSASQGVANPTITLNTQATVVRPADASWSASRDVEAGEIELSVAPDSGVHQFMAPIHNLGFDGESNQALLDIDAVDAPSSPFAYVGGKAMGIGAAPATPIFAFDSTGLPPGLFSTQVTVDVSDENLPGEMSSALQLTINVTVGGAEPCEADIAPAGSPNGVVNVDDLLAVISAWGACPDPGARAPGSCPADIAPAGSPNGVVNVDDLLAVINAWGRCG